MHAYIPIQYSICVCGWYRLARKFWQRSDPLIRFCLLLQDSPQPAPPDPSRVHILYTTFTFIDRFVKDARPVAITTSETISRVTSLVPGQTAPSGSTRRTETFFTTYTYYKTESANAEGGRPRITSTEEVTTQVVVTEAARLPAVVPRPTAVRPVVLTTVPPQRLTLMAPNVEPSLSTDGAGDQNSVVMAATRTFYTTSTFYTTLVEGESTAIRSRTELTSRVQTELSTTWLQLASAVQPLVSQTVTWLGQSGQQQHHQEQQQEQQHQVPVKQLIVAAAAEDQVDAGNNDSSQSTVTDGQSSVSAPADASEADKNAVLQAIQALIAEADKENTGAGQAASAPAALIPDTIIGTAGSLSNVQLTADSQSSILFSGELESAAATAASVTKPSSMKPEATNVFSGNKPITLKLKTSSHPTKTDTHLSRKPTKPQASLSSKPTKSQVQVPSKPTKPQASKPTKQQAAVPSKPVKAQTASKPVKHQTFTPSQFLVAPAPVAAPIPATSTIQTSVQTSTSTSVSESSALTPGLGGLAGGLLGLGGLAAGLIRNVIPLPLPLRRDGSPGVPVSGSTFQRPRPGRRPGVRLAPRPARPGLRLSGANRRHQTPVKRNDSGYLVVIGPDGQRIHLNRAPEAGHTPPTRRTGYLAGIPSRGGPSNGAQAPQLPQRHPGLHGGAPVRRLDRPRRPQPVSRPLTRIPSRIDGPPPRRVLRPGRPGRPLGRPYGRPVGPIQLHRPGRPVSRRPRPLPTGYIAVRSGDPTPPSDFQREPSQIAQLNHGGPFYTEEQDHSHTEVSIHRPQPVSSAHVAPKHSQHGAVGPPPQHTGPVKSMALQHVGVAGQSHQQHLPDIGPTNPNHGGNVRPLLSQGAGAVRPPPVRQHVTDAIPPSLPPQGSVRPQPALYTAPVRLPHQSHAQVSGMHGNQANLQGRPHHMGTVISQVPSTGVSTTGASVPHSQSETLYREHLVKAPQLQADTLVFKSEVNGPPPPGPDDAEVTSQLPSYYELNNGVAQEEPSDDQKSSASVFTNIGPDGSVHNDPEGVVRVIAAPTHVGGQETPVVPATPILVPTLHTIASVEGPNRIVGTNVFKQVGPLSTLKTVELGAGNVPVAVVPTQVAKIHTAQITDVLSSSTGDIIGGTESSPSSSLLNDARSDFTTAVSSGFSGSEPDSRPMQSLGPENEDGTGIKHEQSKTSIGALVTGTRTAEGSLTGNNGEFGAGFHGSQTQGFHPQLSEGTLAHFGQQTSTQGSQLQAIFNTNESLTFPEAHFDNRSSLSQEESLDPDDSEDQYASSTIENSVGDDRESEYISLSNNERIPGAPSLPGLAGIGFEQQTVTAPSVVRNEPLGQANTLGKYDEEPTLEYDDKGKPNPTIGYDYSVPQYAQAFEDANAEQRLESDSNAKLVESPTVEQSTDGDASFITGSAVNSQMPSHSGKSELTTSNGVISDIYDSSSAGILTVANEHNRVDGANEHNRVDGVSAWTNGNGEDIGESAQKGAEDIATVNIAWTNAPSVQTGEPAWNQGSAVEGEDYSQWNERGQPGQGEVTTAPLEETVVSAWTQSPEQEGDGSSESAKEHQEQLAESSSEYSETGGSDSAAWNSLERPASVDAGWSDGQRGNSKNSSWKEGNDGKLFKSTSVNGQLPEGENPGWANGHVEVENAPFRSTQQSDEEPNVFDQQKESNGDKAPITASEDLVISTGSSTSEKHKESPFEAHFTQEQDGIPDKTSTKDSVDDTNDLQGTAGASRATRKPFRGIVRPSTSWKASGGTVRPSSSSRPFRGTVRPSAIRKPYRESARPSVTRRPFRGTRRPHSTRRPFTEIKQQAWVQLTRNASDSTVSTSDIYQETETYGTTEANSLDPSLDSEQSYGKTVNVEVNNSGSAVVFSPFENEDNDSDAYEAELPEVVEDLSVATQQELDLDLDPSIKEEWVQIGDNSETADSNQGGPGVGLASSEEEVLSGATASGSRTPGLNTFRLPERKKPSRRPSLADIIRQTLRASGSSSSSTLGTVHLSNTKSQISISSTTIAPSRTRIPPGFSTSGTADRRRIPPGIVRPGLVQEENEQFGGLAWPSRDDTNHDTGNSNPVGEQETATVNPGWDYGQTGETANPGWSYGEDYESGASGPGFGENYETGTSAPGYYSNYYETGTSISSDDGTPQDAQSESTANQDTLADDKAKQTGSVIQMVDGEVNDMEQSVSSEEQAEGDTEQTVEAETSQTPKAGVDVTLSVSTSEASEEVSVQQSVSEAAAPADDVTKAAAGSERPVEVVVGVSTTGGVIADVALVTTTEDPVPTTESPAATSVTPKVSIHKSFSNITFNAYLLAYIMFYMSYVL